MFVKIIIILLLLIVIVSLLGNHGQERDNKAAKKPGMFLERIFSSNHKRLTLRAAMLKLAIALLIMAALLSIPHLTGHYSWLG